MCQGPQLSNRLLLNGVRAGGPLQLLGGSARRQTIGRMALRVLSRGSKVRHGYCVPQGLKGPATAAGHPASGVELEVPVTDLPSLWESDGSARAPVQGVVVMRGSILSERRCKAMALVDSQSSASQDAALVPGQAPGMTRVGGAAQGGISARSRRDTPCRQGCGPLFGRCIKLVKKEVCTMCTPLWFRIGSYGCRTGLEPGSSAISGTVFPLFRRLWAPECAQPVH